MKTFSDEVRELQDKNFAENIATAKLIIWQRWEGQTSRQTEPPKAAAELFRILNKEEKK